MAVKTKTQLHADTAALPAPITRASLITVLDDMVDSYEDIIQEYTTAARNALTPVQGQKIFNTTNKRLEIYSGTAWLPCSQKDAVALDASSNPNYPQGGVGDLYTITVAGKVGGAGGKSVYVGDMVYCISENAGGNEATVGTSWKVCHSEANGAAQIKKVTLTIVSSDVLTLNSVPITIIPAVTGKAIQVIGGNIKFPSATINYATNTTLRIYTTANTYNQATFNISNYNSYATITLTTPSAGDTPIEISNNIDISVATGNPTTGDGDIEIVLFYIEN